MIEVTGQVVVEGSGAPVVGVVVELFDLSGSEASPGQDRRGEPAGTATLIAQPSLGSAATGTDGTFSLSIDSGLNADPLRMALGVFAPDSQSEETSSDLGSLLHLTDRRRLATSGSHHYVISIPADRLRTLPDGMARRGLPPAAATAFAAKATGQAEVIESLHAGIREVRGKAADRSRADRVRTQKAVAEALFERAVGPLRGPQGDLPDTVVAPDQSVRLRTRELIDKAVRTQASKITVRGLVDISDADAVRLLDNNGVPLPSVTDDDIRRLLFGPAHTEGPAARYRRDLLEAACRDGRPPYERCPQGPQPEETEGSAGSDAEADNAEGEASLGLIKTMLAKLLDRSEGIATAAVEDGPRATAERIARDLRGLTLASGPADAVALFDFERLLLASDLPVRPRHDPGLLTDLTEGVGLIAALGGDLDAHLRGGKDLLDALAAETALLAASDPLAPPDSPPSDVAFFGLPNPIGVLSGLAGAAGSVLDLVIPGRGSGAGTGADGGYDGRIRDHRGEPTTGGSPRSEQRDRFIDLRRFIARLQRVRRSDYGFTPFATDDKGRSASFGLLLRYRQEWEPFGYQAGELVKTIPLGPKETVRYVTRRKHSRSYTDKRAEASETTYSSETTDVQRDLARIVRNAKLATSFSLTNQSGGGVPGAASTTTTSVWQTSAERSSESTKEAFREETRKQAEELRRSSSAEVTLSTTDEVEFEEVSEVGNPTDELVVTYLFYELQRRFRVSERLQQVVPVVLVAQELPAPSEIDEAWIIRNDWVLRRVMLDGSFLPAIDYVASGKLVADLGRAKELEVNLDRQFEVVAALAHQLDVLRSPELLPDPRNIIEQWKVRLYDDRYPDWRQDEQRVREVFGDDVADRMRERRRSVEKVESELKREVAQLERATEIYTEAFVRYAVEAVQVERLLMHIKENILYYQQALWEHEGRDQRYLRLRHMPVPEVVGTLSYQLQPTDRPPRAPTWRPPLEVQATARLQLGGDRPLSEVADLTNPLGYVGNAIVLPLQRFDPLVELLMVTYSSGLTGVSDPDEQGNATLADLDRLICCLKDTLPEPAFDALKPRIDAAYRARVADPRVDAQEVVLPTGSLFIEALPGAHPLLEDFKLAHRALDVQQVASDLVAKRLEHLRLAARLVNEELDDPDIEQTVVVKGDTEKVVVSTPHGPSPPGGEG